MISCKISSRSPFLKVYMCVIYLIFNVLMPSYINCFRMERQRREDEMKNRSSKKAPDAEQSSLNRV